MVNTIFILDKAYNTSLVLVGNRSSQRTFWDDMYVQEFDTGAETFEFTCEQNEFVVEGNYVAFYYNNQYKMFTIMEIEQRHKEGKIVTVCYCETAGLSLLNNYIRPFSGDLNCIQFFDQILMDTGWSIGKYSNSLKNNVQTINVSKVENVWTLIEDYKDIFGCELNVRVTYENGHVTGKYIDLYSEGGLGSPTYKRLEYGRNVSGIVKKKDLYDWCTAIIMDVDCDVTNVIVREEDGYGFTKGAGDVILNDNANRMYNANRSYVVGVYDGKEIEPMEACINAWKELEKRSVPRFDYTVTTALTEDEYEDLRLGDTVYVVDHAYTPPLFLEARVGTLELSFTDRTKNSCTLTNYKEVKSRLLDADYIKLTGTITDVVNAFFPVTSEGIADGAITEGKIETTYFQQITADIVSAGIGAFEDLYAQNLTVINADIENLRAETADISHLKSKVAEVDTLVNGHLTSDNIQSMIITGDKFTVEDAFIKDAMIDNINASKINAGVLNTNNVVIQSDDGGMLLQGNLQQFKDSSGKVRIQLGKDAQGNFTFCLFSQDGVGVLLDEEGLHAGAVPDGLIVNAMVADGANISGGKLDINSVITSINNSSTTIKSNKIFLDEQGQSLEVAFDALKTQVETIQEVTINGDLSSIIEQVVSNTTSINIMQGEINSLIANTTITKENGEVVQLKDEYNYTKNTVDSHVSKIGTLETTVTGVTSKQSSMEQDLNGFKSTVFSDYATKTDLNSVQGASRNFLKGTTEGRTLTGNSSENQFIWLYDISEPSLLAGQTVTVSFEFTLDNWNGEGGIKAQTGYTKYDQFEQVWFWSAGRYTYTSTITFSGDNADWSLLLRADWLGGTVNVLPNTARLVLGGNKSIWVPAPEDTIEDIEALSSSVEQTADKISWVVESGSSKSDMSLTAEAYNLVSQNINLTADHINLHGYVTANGNFKIDQQGNLEAKNGSFEGALRGASVWTTAVNNKYMQMKTSDFAAYNGDKKVISVGLRGMSQGPDTEATTENPGIYMGASGININGGTSYTGDTGRYYGRWLTYSHDNLQSSDSKYYQMPYMEMNFNTDKNARSGNPATSQFRFMANGDMLVSPVTELQIRSHSSKGAFVDGVSEIPLATFKTANTEFYNGHMQTQAIVNHTNGDGLVLADRFYSADGNGDSSTSGTFWTVVAVDSGIDSNNEPLRTFKPLHDNLTNLGTSLYRWRKVYAGDGTISTSDRRAKENIQYVTNVENARIVMNEERTEEVVGFIRDIPYATFNMKDEEDVNIGFILQDLMEINPDLTNELLLEKVVIEKGREDENIPLLGYRTNNYINMLGMTVQHLLKRVEELEQKIEKLESDIQ